MQAHVVPPAHIDRLGLHECITGLLHPQNMKILIPLKQTCMIFPTEIFLFVIMINFTTQMLNKTKWVNDTKSRGFVFCRKEKASYLNLVSQEKTRLLHNMSSLGYCDHIIMYHTKWKILFRQRKKLDCLIL